MTFKKIILLLSGICLPLIAIFIGFVMNRVNTDLKVIFPIVILAISYLVGGWIIGRRSNENDYSINIFCFAVGPIVLAIALRVITFLFHPGSLAVVILAGLIFTGLSYVGSTLGRLLNKV